MYLLILVVYSQTINTRVADLLDADGGTLYKTDIILSYLNGWSGWTVIWRSWCDELDHNAYESQR